MKSKKKLLIVEDDKDMQAIYEDMIGKKYDFVIVGNTRKAEQELKKNPPDLMILDIILPEESGEMFFQRIKKMSVYKDLKILCITVLGDVSDFFKKIDHKTECLAKPFEKEKLLFMINKMLKD